MAPSFIPRDQLLDHLNNLITRALDYARSAQHQGWDETAAEQRAYAQAYRVLLNDIQDWKNTNSTPQEAPCA